MSDPHVLTGKIISTSTLKNNTFRYMIKTDKSVDTYVFFANNSTYPDGLDTSRLVTIKYETKMSPYGRSNIIKEASHGDFITDSNSIIDFLVNRLKLSKNFSHKLVEAHGNKSLDVIFNHTDELRKIVDPEFPTMLKLIEEYKSKNIESEFLIELTKLGVLTRYHGDIIGKLGRDINRIKSNIYDLYTICHVPFAKCDEIAVKLKYAMDDPGRISAFIIMMFKQFNSQGILYETSDIIGQICRKYQIPMEKVIPKLVQITAKKYPYFTTEKLYFKEAHIENICNKLASQKPITRLIFDDNYYIANTTLDDSQRLAVKNAFENCLSIVTGPPGTGKSFIIKHIIKKLYVNNFIYVMAPTGAAVERLRNETIEEYSGKIITLQSFVFQHKSLEANKHSETQEEDAHKRGTVVPEDKMTIYDLYPAYDEFVFFIDEMSMVDLGLFNSFLEIIEKILDKVRIVLLGDKNQLPSIKGGYILGDLIDSNIIKYTTLVHAHRSVDKFGKVNDIMENAELALAGLDLKEASSNVEIIPAQTRRDVKNILQKIIPEKHIKYENSCVLIPIRKKGICIDVFNPILQNIYNPDPANRPFRPGDKIMHGKNNKKKEIYNGSILVACDVLYGEKDYLREMKCKYYRNETCINTADPNFRHITYQWKNSENKNDFLEDKIELAYAMTVHKAQGKGYDTAIGIIHSSMSPQVLSRNLLYTMISRAKQRFILIADESGLHLCKRILARRITNLYRRQRIEINKMISNNSFFDLVWIIRKNLNLAQIHQLLQSNGINPANFHNDNLRTRHNELTKLYLRLMHDGDLFKKLLSTQFLPKLQMLQTKSN